MRYDDLYHKYSQRYVAKIGNGWFLLTPTLLVALPEPVTGATPLVLTEIADGWTPGPDYSLQLAGSLGRQLLRLPDEMALVSKNLIAVKHSGKVSIYWADTQKVIGEDCMLALEQYGDSSYRATKTRSQAIENISKMLDHDWGLVGNQLARKVKQQPTNGKFGDVAAELRVCQMVCCERLLFERLYATRLAEMADQGLSKLGASIKVRTDQLESK